MTRPWRAVAIYTVLTLLLAYPLSLKPDRIAWANDPDSHIVMWLLAWDTHAFLHQPWSIFEANTFYPEHRTLALQENLIGSAFFAAPVLWLTGNPVLAANFVSLLACVLCGLGAYVLARRVGIGEAGALLCGVVFAFSPPRFLRFPQTHLAVVQWIPFALASLHTYLESGRRRDLLLAVAFFALQVMSSGHGGVFLVVAIALMLAFRLAFGEPVLWGKRLRDFGVAGALLLLPVVLFLIPYRINQVEMGLRRSLGSWDAPLASFFASPTRVDIFLRSLIMKRDVNATATAFLFPGFLPLALALAAVVAGAAALAHPRMRPTWALAAFSTQRLEVAPRYRLPLGVFAAAALAWVVLGFVGPLLPAGDGLSLQIYANDKVAWTGYVVAGKAGLYNFGVPTDSRSKLSIDNLVIINHIDPDTSAPTTGSVPLTPGSHRVLLEHEHTRDTTNSNLLWAEQGEGKQYFPVPRWVLSQRPVTYQTAFAARTIGRTRIASVVATLAAAIWCISLWLSSRREAWTAWGTPYRSNPTALFLLLTVASVALALGPPYGIWQFVYWLPGFNFIRGSTRFMVLGLLGIAGLAGIGFEKVSARLAPRAQLATAAVVCVLMAAEFAAQPFSTPYTFEIPAADQWVAQQPKPFVVAEVPSAGGYERYQTMYMLHSMAHWQKTVNGYGGIRPYVHSVLYQELDTFPDARSVQHLAELDVTYVIVHIDLYPPQQWPEVEARLNAFGDRLVLKYSDPIGRVYALRRPQEITMIR